MNSDERDPGLGEGDWTHRVDRLFAETLGEQMRRLADQVSARVDAMSLALAEQAGVQADMARALAQIMAAIHETRTRIDEGIQRTIGDVREAVSRIDVAVRSMQERLASFKRADEAVILPLSSEQEPRSDDAGASQMDSDRRTIFLEPTDSPVRFELG